MQHEPINYRITNNRLYVNDTLVPFKYPVDDRETIQVEDLLLVVLYTGAFPEGFIGLKRGDEDYGRNVYAVNKDGKIVWRIQRDVWSDTVIGLTVHEDGAIVIGTDMDRFHLLNLADGTTTYKK
ncbi:hypothetical protein G7B40_039835 [Aetokthonos hydrillicola Thurmond2011]|jgi:hypothetical protein|uniref:Uncharacterized protein n=1 Tax=Aetokthonos hydrillicola Thurmond2011 TaxID=2712845 RepID=A0AAP5IHD2_9CYAN|nr:PQQ-like beta-propeller repeat protein [Aetokthonos hydrillicola]MBW4590127.1 hypothetical protein [Aetokthonos hydrillicola CCALA 1050]MDR9900642.1 hypothetical protein [Aetokthonos hydrillicola Thurmond2011]